MYNMILTILVVFMMVVFGCTAMITFTAGDYTAGVTCSVIAIVALVILAIFYKKDKEDE